MLEKPERDWTEDAPHENGNYECKCAVCQNKFMGHKRRIVCKQCDADTKNVPKDSIDNVEVAMVKINSALGELTLEEGFSALSHTICRLAISTGISKDGLIRGVGGSYDVIMNGVINRSN